MRFASLKSPNLAVRARLQAALFANRKRNKSRRTKSLVFLASSVILGNIGENDSPGFSEGLAGTLNIQPNTNFPLEFICFYSDEVYITFIGDCASFFLDSSFFSSDLEMTGSFISSVAELAGDETIRTNVRYSLVSGLTSSNYGDTISFEFLKN